MFSTKDNEDGLSRDNSVKDRDRARKHLSGKLRKAFRGSDKSSKEDDKPAGNGISAIDSNSANINDDLTSQVLENLKKLGFGGDEVSEKININKALENNYSNGNIAKATELLLFFKDSFEGLLAPITHSVNDQPYYYPIIGSDNYHGVSCYVDSLLFAMFARIRNFEPILYKEYESDEKRDTLALFLRLYVSMLRSGKLVTTDIVGGLMDALIDAGWRPIGGKMCQQDAGELFAFITEKLNMPLLTLKVDIAHGGKEVKEDDHKLINESLLHVPIPGSKTDGPILLEECLELYFANSVQVSRQLERRRTLDSVDQMPFELVRDKSFMSTSSLNTETTPKKVRPRKFSLHIEPMSLPRRATESTENTEEVESGQSGETAPINIVKQRTGFELSGEPLEGSEQLSIVSSVLVDEDSSQNSPSEEDEIEFKTPGFAGQKSATESSSELPTYESVYKPGDSRIKSILDAKNQLRRGSNTSTTSHDSQRLRSQNMLWNSNMEITLPAWMFLQLLPFYTDASDKIDTTTTHATSSPVAKHFANARPVLGICLKRYAMTKNGDPVRNDRLVVVPQTIRLPSFVADDQQGPDDPQSQNKKHSSPFGKFELVLESAVFHRGESLNSGHFVAITSEDAFIPYDDSTVAQNTRSKKRSKADRLWTSLRSKESKDSAKNSTGSAGASLTALGSGSASAQAPNHSTTNNNTNLSLDQISPPNSAFTSPALKPIDVGPPMERRWVLFDDLKPVGEKVTPVDYNKIFSTECPYMLFYRMVAIDDDEDNNSSASTSASPSPSRDSNENQEDEGGLGVRNTSVSLSRKSTLSSGSGRGSVVAPPLVTISPVDTLDLNTSPVGSGDKSTRNSVTRSSGTRTSVGTVLDSQDSNESNDTVATSEGSYRSSMESNSRTLSQFNPFNSRSSRSRAASPDKSEKYRHRHHRSRGEDKYREEKCRVM